MQETRPGRQADGHKPGPPKHLRLSKKQAGDYARWFESYDSNQVHAFYF